MPPTSSHPTPPFFSPAHFLMQVEPDPGPTWLAVSLGLEGGRAVGGGGALCLLERPALGAELEGNWGKLLKAKLRVIVNRSRE